MATFGAFCYFMYSSIFIAKDTNFISNFAFDNGGVIYL